MKLTTEQFEALSELEHIQWKEWSKCLAKEIEDWICDISQGETIVAFSKMKTRLDKWEKNWIPYNKLTEEIKEYDRVWTRKLEDILENCEK